MENISLAISLFGFALVWFITLIYPPAHVILRKKKNYNRLFYFSILSVLLSILVYNNEMPQNRKETSFLALYLLFFLLMYRYFDNYILKRNNRNLYFKIKYNSVWNNEESDEATSIEEWFQFSLTILPIILCYALKYLVLDLLINITFK
ncbi:hypothetical protein DBB36_19170 [Flavobacterium sp. WLB]|uniref:hypothetical protein n=1 Tax=unclassified Flavobacterium TaxID=196869 RepID=UPI0006ABD392|nr:MULTISPECIES: hypothetical protein [unclassified Flavobacterium]KOP37731.1 hypothetical protein AKO67_13835 [Flavobacterium sp. VMW]OWU88273.1 hypothetical protein APR43_23680 [Flavobacterium sp. NLM]PUU68364.1 hypothetical protein DBB36_19170 [Flavobacterium sp. WLB]